MEKEKKEKCQPLETERHSAAMFVLVPSTRSGPVPGEGSLHSARISLSLSWEDP